MIIQGLELKDFRNYESISIQFDEGTNILYGDNAQGKTNILESIFISSTTKSHKGSKDKEIVSFGKEDAFIRTMIIKDNNNYKVDLHLKSAGKKEIAINNKRISKAGDLLGITNIVFFSPEDLSIIKNAASERRHFMDIELCQLDKFYLYNLSNYNKVVINRNKILKEMLENRYLEDTLGVWNSQLISYGTKIIERRKLFIDSINEIIEEIHLSLSGKKELLRIEYQPNVDVNEYEKELEKNKEKDYILKQTTCGPHRDDIVFYINEIDVRKYGSQGQQRTAALSLKLAEIELVKKLINDNPILLLDDVLSELDSNRQNYLLNYIGDIQTIITCTGLDEFINNRFKINKLFNVVNGKIISDN